MEPELVVRREIDVVVQSPLLRGLVLAMSYADENDGIDLTKSGAAVSRVVV